MADDDFDNMTNKELYEHLEKMVSTHAEDVEKKVGGDMEKMMNWRVPSTTNSTPSTPP